MKLIKELTVILDQRSGAVRESLKKKDVEKSQNKNGRRKLAI